MPLALSSPFPHQLHLFSHSSPHSSPPLSSYYHSLSLSLSRSSLPIPTTTLTLSLITTHHHTHTLSLTLTLTHPGDLVVTKGDQYDVRESSSSGGSEVRNLGKPVDLARRYFEEGADEVTFLNITGFRYVCMCVCVSMCGGSRGRVNLLI